MNNLKLCFLGNPVLREISKPVSEINDNTRKILFEMEHVMRHENGIGLAAPQVGILERMLIFIDIEHDVLYKVINPKVISKSEEIIEMDEGCLSIQGPQGPVFAPVKRPASVVIEYNDENGKVHKKEFTGVASRTIQHEIDHLDGILFIDYLSSAKREMIIRKTKKRL